MSFEIIIKAERLHNYTGHLAPFVDEAAVPISPDGIGATVVDPANVASVDQSLDAAAFEAFDVEGEWTVGVNLSRLEDIASLADSDDPVSLEYDDRTRKVEFRTNGLDYTLATIDPDSIRASPDIPELDLPVTIWAEWQTLARGITAADMVSDHVAFGYDNDAGELYVKAEGDTDDVYLSEDRGDLIDVDASGDAHSLFSIDYLESLKRAVPSRDTEVKMMLGNEFPTKVSWSWADGHGDALVMIAPRIQSD